MSEYENRLQVKVCQLSAEVKDWISLLEHFKISYRTVAGAPELFIPCPLCHARSGIVLKTNTRPWASWSCICGCSRTWHNSFIGLIRMFLHVKGHKKMPGQVCASVEDYLLQQKAQSDIPDILKRTKINFGKYQNQCFSELPPSYLKWIRDKVGSAVIRDAINEYLNIPLPRETEKTIEF